MWDCLSGGFDGKKKGDLEKAVYIERGGIRTDILSLRR